MAKKEMKSKKEKPLEKMTAKELRDLGLTIPELTGVHGMNKAELIAAIKEIRGIVDETKKDATDVREIKQRIKALKEKRALAVQEGADKAELEALRKKISRLKKKTRRAA